MTETVVTPAQAFAGLIGSSTGKWVGNITYSIPGAGALWLGGYGVGETSNTDYGVLNAGQANNFRVVMEMWDSYIAPSITEVSDATPGQIRVAFTDVTEIRNNPGIAAYAYGPPQGAVVAVHGDVWVDESFKSSTFAFGSSEFETLLHEVGHSLGMKHSFEAPAVPPGYDSTTYSIMSYTTEDRFYKWSSSGGSIFYSTTDTVNFTPMVLDILAIQAHYGADTTTSAGNTIYTVTNVDGRQAIYDAGGNDTLDLSLLPRLSHVDLRPGAYSDLAYYSVADQKADLIAQYGAAFAAFISATLDSGNAFEWERNLGIAFSTVIENVIGTAFGDTIIGNNVSNRIDGGAGIDQMTGLQGSDTYLVDVAGDTIVEALNEGIDTVNAYATYTLAANVENLSLFTLNNLNATGNGLANTLTGNAGVNVLDGLTGADTMRGRAGSDLYRVDNMGDIVDEADGGGGGTDTVQSTITFSLVNSATVLGAVENVSLLGGLNINATGNALANTLWGNAGVNILDGLTGADTMRGRGGSDLYRVDNVGDIVDEADGGGGGIDTVQSTITFSLSSNPKVLGVVENVSLLGTANINATGNALANTLWGNAGVNILDGLTGADTMRGRGGSDLYRVDNVGDIVDEADGGGGGIDTVQSTISFSLVNSVRVLGAVENLSLTGAGSISATGNGLANKIWGGTGSNSLTGNGGADIFVFHTALNAATNVDTITDFAIDDTIQLENAVFTALTTLGTLLAGQFFIGASAHDADDRIIYNSATGALSYDFNGNAVGGGVKFAQLSAGLALTSGDFFVI